MEAHLFYTNGNDPYWSEEFGIYDQADQFTTFFEPHQQKVVNLYHDRVGNSYKKVGQYLAGKLKEVIEKDA